MLVRMQNQATVCRCQRRPSSGPPWTMARRWLAPAVIAAAAATACGTSAPAPASPEPAESTPPGPETDLVVSDEEKNPNKHYADDDAERANSAPVEKLEEDEESDHDAEHVAP
jgi:hypothetical protein